MTAPRGLRLDSFTPKVLCGWQVLRAMKEKPLVVPTFGAFARNHIRARC